jgi:hypothetical protein
MDTIETLIEKAAKALRERGTLMRLRFQWQLEGPVRFTPQPVVYQSWPSFPSTGWPFKSP